MQKRLVALSAVVVLALAWSLAQASDQKPVTLTGDMMCAKCTLKEASKCSDVLVVKEDGKDVQYSVTYADPSVQQHVCTGKKHMQVTGTVGEKDGHKTIAASKVQEIKSH